METPPVAKVTYPVLEQARKASEFRGRSFMRILEAGEDDGLVYFASNLNDGEFVADYVSRQGALAPVTSLALVYQLLDDLLKIKDCQQMLSHIRLNRVLVTAQEDAFLQLRLIDYGLAGAGRDEGALGKARLLEEACRLLFLLMTGQPYGGGNPGDFPAIAELPTSLHLMITAALAKKGSPAVSIQTLQHEIREAICLKVTLVQARNLRRLLVVESSLLPRSHLRDLLLEHAPVEAVLGPAFLMDDTQAAASQPFAIPVISAATGQTLTLHLLPPARIVDPAQLAELSPRLWRCDPANQPNLLHVRGLWKGPDWTFLAEEREPGLSLSRLMADRLSLNPNEVALLLRQLSAGMEQAVESGVQRVNLDPSNIVLCVGYDGPVLPRDRERLLQKRLDAWPKFVVKLRLHKTMRGFCEPRLVDLSPLEGEPDVDRVGAAREQRHRSFIGLAAYLLTGEGQIGRIPQLSPTLPARVGRHVLECLNLALLKQKVPEPGEFIDKLDLLLSGETAEIATRLPEAPIDLEEMDHAGSVSDFEEDWPAQDDDIDLPPQNIISPASRSHKPNDFQRLNRKRPRVPWVALAAAGVLILGVITALMTQGGGFNQASPDKLAESSPSPVEEPTAPEALPPKTVSAPPPAPRLEQQTQIVKREVTAIPEPAAPPPALTASVSHPPPSQSAELAETPEPVTIRRAIAVPSNDSPPAEVLAANIPASPPPVSSNQAPVPTKPAVGKVANAPASPLTPVPAVPAPETTASNTLTIRQAIVLTSEEIEQIMQEQAKSKEGGSSAPDSAGPSPEIKAAQ